MLKNAMLKHLLVAGLLAVSLPACAADQADAPRVGQGVTPAAQKMVRAAISSMARNVTIESIDKAPIPGFYQVIASGQLVYISADGKYLMNGDLVDVRAHKSLSDGAWSAFRKAQLAKVPASQRIIFAPPHPKATLTVFTDVNCGYCRALQDQIGAFNKAGIAIEYLAWPREGVTTTSGSPTPTYTEMVSVWCSADRKASFNQAKKGVVPKPVTCDNPVKSQFELGRRLGVSGTPTVIASDGRVIGGFVTPEQVLADLKQHGELGG